MRQCRGQQHTKDGQSISCGAMHDLGNKGLPEKASPDSPQNLLQITRQPGDRAWADLALQEKGSTALQKHRVWGNEADAFFLRHNCEQNYSYSMSVMWELRLEASC